MANPLTMDDIREEDKGKIFVQDYSPKKKISGVQVIPLKNIVGEDGDFSELLRLSDGQVQGIEGFEVKQINRSKLIAGGIKAWHLHLNQEDMWYLPPSYSLIVGLYDLRKDSDTGGVSMKLSLGGGNSHLLYIPRGVAHGMANVSGRPINLFYFVNQQFNIEDPDERRLPWDTLGADFFTPTKE